MKAPKNMSSGQLLVALTQVLMKHNENEAVDMLIEVEKRLRNFHDAEDKVINAK